MVYRGLVAHISDHMLDLYAIKKVPEADVAALEVHLLMCAECQDQLQLTDDFIEALRAEAGSRRARQPRRA